MNKFLTTIRNLFEEHPQMQPQRYTRNTFEIQNGIPFCAPRFKIPNEYFCGPQNAKDKHLAWIQDQEGGRHINGNGFCELTPLDGETAGEMLVREMRRGGHTLANIRYALLRCGFDTPDTLDNPPPPQPPQPPAKHHRPLNEYFIAQAE